jgi:hypothetical protein
VFDIVDGRRQLPLEVRDDAGNISVGVRRIASQDQYRQDMRKIGESFGCVLLACKDFDGCASKAMTAGGFASAHCNNASAHFTSASRPRVKD